MEYGLIGKTLGHSFSKIVHEALTDYGYELYPLPTEEEFHDFMKVKNFAGINVTIPYKQDVIPYCHSLDEKAKSIGAVNSIVNKNGTLCGYNTDYDGFLYQCQRQQISLRDKVVLILGTGGTFKTVSAVARDQGATAIFVASRNPSGTENASVSQKEEKEQTELATEKRSVTPQFIRYDQATSPDMAQNVQVIINTSPVGMFPHNQAQAIDLDYFPHLTAVVDVVYNPLCSLLVYNAKQRHLPAVGGLAMLVAQAKYAAEYFTQTEIPEENLEKVFAQIGQKQSNLVLIGMPASGKSTLGRKVAQNMGRHFVDFDEVIQKKAQKSIPEIFAQEGEEAFRQLETEICWEYGVKNGMVLSTGGGVVTREKNIAALSQNGMFIYVNRDLAFLDIGKNRPLSQSRTDVLELYEQRKTLYEKTAHRTVENNVAIHLVAKKIQEAYYEFFNSGGA